MIELADVGLLGCVALTLLVSLAIARRHLRGVDHEIQSYRLQAVRDDLAYFVAEDRLALEDPIFRAFHGSADHLSQHVHRMNLEGFVAAIERQRELGKDPGERRKAAELAHRLNTINDEQVTRVVAAYFDAVRSIFYENSRLIRILVDHKWIRNLLRRIFGSARKPPTEVRFFFDYERARRITARCC